MDVNERRRSNGAPRSTARDTPACCSSRRARPDADQQRLFQTAAIMPDRRDECGVMSNPEQTSKHKRVRPAADRSSPTPPPSPLPVSCNRWALQRPGPRPRPSPSPTAHPMQTPH
uniref:Uncharacterized protein n=1 Tax=Plectus sambesii TaxID=2011161 RepID=A0A914V4E3_9BILA